MNRDDVITSMKRSYDNKIDRKDKSELSEDKKTYIFIFMRIKNVLGNVKA